MAISIMNDDSIGELGSQFITERFIGQSFDGRLSLSMSIFSSPFLLCLGQGLPHPADLRSFNGSSDKEKSVKS